MRVAIMGSGAVGGYFGGRLAAAGNEVTFIARGRQLAALRANGLRLDSASGDLHLPRVNATDDPSSAGPVDVVFFSVKLWDTAVAADAIRPLMHENTAVVSFQNGVVKDDILRSTLGPEHVVGGLCYIDATITEPGVVRHSGALQRLQFGEYDGVLSSRVRDFRDACAASGIDVDVSERIEQAIWEKFVFLVGLSGTTTTARTSIGPIRTNPRSRAFLHDVMAEVVTIARAQNVPLPADYAEVRLAFVDQLPAGMTSSMHRDLEGGNRIEVPWLSGDVVDRGKQLGIPTPCNRAIADILAVHTSR